LTGKGEFANGQLSAQSVFPATYHPEPIIMAKKNDILQAAAAMFAGKGFKHTSMTEVAEMTQVAEATIYYHFKTKEELFLAVLEHARKSIIAEFEAYFQKTTAASGMALAEDAIGFYLYLAAQQEIHFLLLHRNYTYELARKNTVCRQHLVAIYNCIVDIFEKVIRTGQSDGSIAKELSTRKTALILVSLINGMLWFKNCDLYNASALFGELIQSCHRLLKP
jgi:AcrR family transcriptional regulator